MNSTKSKIILEYDITRVFAVALVVIAHSTYYTITTKYGGIDYFDIMSNANIGDTFIHKILNIIVNAIYTFHMPLFVALSGTLFSVSTSNNKNISLKSIIKNKYYRLIIPFIIVTIIYSVPIKLISGYYTYPNFTSLLRDIFYGQLLLMGNSHLWYLPSLFLDFIFIYLLCKYVRKKSIITIFLIAIHFISFKIQIPLISNPLKFAIWFYMGCLFEEKRILVNKCIKEKHNLIFSTILIFTLAFFLSRYINNTNFILSIIKEIVICCCTITGCFFVYNISYLLAIKTNIENNRYLKLVSNNSLGIYLYSDSLNYAILFIFYKFFTINLFGNEIGSLIMFLFRMVLTGVIALLISSLLKRYKVKYVC